MVLSQSTKGRRAAELLAGGGTISLQVLDEFASVAIRKLRRTMHETRLALSNIRAVCAIRLADVRTDERDVDVAERYGFSIYGSMLTGAALEAGCHKF